MLKSVIKYINISYFFLICININGNIMLDENDKLTTPLPLPYNGEIYNVEFYHQTSSTNLSIGAATKIDWQTQINIDRQTDDPYNQAPVSSFTQYTDNDLTSVANTNVEYGTQTA